MAGTVLSADQVKALLAHNGISNIDDLANQAAEISAKNPGAGSISIKPDAKINLIIQILKNGDVGGQFDLPDHLGGKLLRDGGGK